jgi:hypothetical protein
MPTSRPPVPPQINLETRGRLTVLDEDGQPVKIVIQRVGRKFGNGRILNARYQVQVRRDPGTIKDRMSGPQLIRRARFSEAVKAWQDLGEVDRAAWQRHARRQSRTGYNMFIAQHMRRNGLPPTPRA